MSTDLSSTLLDAVSETIGAIGTAAFPKSLDSLVAIQAPYDFTAIIVFPLDLHPVLLHDGFGEFRCEVALKNYLQGTYLLDPVYLACLENPNSGLYRMSELERMRFFDTEYVSCREIHPCVSMNPGAIAEEVVYLSPLAEGAWATYSVMRSKDNNPFTAAEFGHLKAVEKIVCNAMYRNWANFVAETDEDGSIIWSRRKESMEHGFESFASYALSPRERMITRLLLEGHTAAAISKKLKIAEGTVKNHKKSIYHKLRISSQAELFALFIEHVCSQYEIHRRFRAQPGNVRDRSQRKPSVVDTRHHHSLILAKDVERH